ncbi:MAG: hypothetical protein M2R45_02606 [Verrucomicrobia subdivision 3 bacterium]|nr:hypothetical protein [Limisphaerales bacterium]MCS1416426.1 hypothetical protein [Limisphaerales bacterium]
MSPGLIKVKRDIRISNRSINLKAESGDADQSLNIILAELEVVSYRKITLRDNLKIENLFPPPTSRVRKNRFNPISIDFLPELPITIAIKDRRDIINPVIIRIHKDGSVIIIGELPGYELDHSRFNRYRSTEMTRVDQIVLKDWRPRKTYIPCYPRRRATSDVGAVAVDNF